MPGEATAELDDRLRELVDIDDWVEADEGLYTELEERKDSCGGLGGIKFKAPPEPTLKDILKLRDVKWRVLGALDWEARIFRMLVAFSKPPIYKLTRPKKGLYRKHCPIACSRLTRILNGEAESHEYTSYDLPG